MRERSILFTLLLFLGTITYGQAKISLEDAVLQQWGKFRPAYTHNVLWIPDSKSYSYVDGSGQKLMMKPAKKDKATELMTAGELSQVTGTDFSRMTILDWKDENHFYTGSSFKYYVVNVGLKTAKLLAEVPKNSRNQELCMANDHVAYTIDNNLYFQTNENKQVQVTDFESDIVSGIGIARREFGISGGIFWSNTGNYLAFYQKDESEVADYPLLDITTPVGSLKSIKYPMAGQSSEKSAVGIYNLETGKTVYIKPKGNPDDYLTNVGWGPKDKFLYIAEVNRDQNEMNLQKYNAETGEFVKTLITEKNVKWVEPEHPVYFVNETQFVWMSEKDGFMNLYLYNDDGSGEKQLTKNKWVAQQIIGNKGNLVYFQGTGDSPLEQNFFTVDIETAEQKTITSGGVHSGTFSGDFEHIYFKMNNRETPAVEWLSNGKGEKIRDAFKSANPLKETELGQVEYGTIKAGDDKTDLYYRMIKPADFDASKKYPVLVYVYGGPHAQLVDNGWLGGARLWMHWMANQGYIVYTLDGRGSANRGFEFESVIHRQLGKAEMEDQLRGVEFLKKQPYVDANRLAVHGWSFGGFMTTSLMLRHPGVFNVGVAGGPVTDWSYYEVMYGERYMDRPEQNEKGYKENRLKEYVEDLEGKLLLIHGTVDDVVVMQHNLTLVQAFISAGKQMDFFPYPMHQHNVRGKDRVHLMEKVLTYIIDNNK